jgi:hypothetical protein
MTYPPALNECTALEAPASLVQYLGCGRKPDINAETPVTQRWNLPSHVVRFRSDLPDFEVAGPEFVGDRWMGNHA